MNKYRAITFLALLAFVLVLPFYSRQETVRMASAQQELQRQYVLGGASIYIQNCAECHGITGEGVGENPALNRFGMANADTQTLYQIIARASHETSMSAWHQDEGGSLNDYQINELVTMIQFADWVEVEAMALEQGVNPKELDTLALTEVYFEGLTEEDPHQCIACHEDPEVHRGDFGLDCVRCHTLEAWTPALLTRHTFALDHGGNGDVACETCHIGTYVQYSCYECHDHQPDEMEEIHEAEAILEIEECIQCHPSGAQGEAERLMQTLVGSDG